MSELGKPPKIARPGAKSLGGGLSRPAGSAPERPAARPAQTGAARPAAARPPEPSGAARPARPRPASPAPPQDAATREKSLVGLGNLLKTKREIHGLTRRDVVVKIKIPLEQLEAIEDGRLSSLPPVFAKGFLRAYANELGLDAETILEDYRRMTGGFKNEPASREPLSARYVESSVGKNRSGSLKGLFIALAGLALLAALLIFLPGLRYSMGAVIPFLNKVPGFVAAETSSGRFSPPAASPEEAPRTEDIVPSTFTQADETDKFVEDPVGRSGNDYVQGQINAPEPAIPQGGTLVLGSREDKVWVMVVVDDQYREHLLMRAGQKAGWKSNRQIVVTTGQANALNVNWDGRDLGVLSDKTIDQVTFPRS